MNSVTTELKENELKALNSKKYKLKETVNKQYIYIPPK